jgi:DNA replication protein DnaC
MTCHSDQADEHEEKPPYTSAKEEIEALIAAVRSRAGSPEDIAEAERVWREAERRRIAIAHGTALELMELPSFVMKSLHGDSWRSTPAYADIRRGANKALTDGRRFVVVHGQPGTGKTFGASGTASDLISATLEEDSFTPIEERREKRYRFYSGRFVSAIELCGDPDNDRVKRLMARTRKPGILILDDAGQERRNRDRLVQVFMELHHSDGICFVTTNIGPDKFEEIYGKRISDRFIENGVLVECSNLERPGVKE